MIRVDTSQLDRLAAALRDASRRIGDSTPVLKLAGLTGVEVVKENFARSQTPEGAGWAPLKKRVGKPLQRTGAMRDGITYDVPNARMLRIGAGALTRAYNAIHNFGGQSWMAPGPAAIPARKYMGFSRAGFERIVDRIKELVMARLRGR